MSPNFALFVFVVIVAGSLFLYHITPQDSADHFEISKMIFKTDPEECAKIFDNVFFTYFNHISDTSSTILEFNSHDMPGDILIEWEGALEFRDTTCHENPGKWVEHSSYPQLVKSFDWNEIAEAI